MHYIPWKKMRITCFCGGSRLLRRTRAEAAASFLVVAVVLVMLYIADEFSSRGEHRRFIIQSAAALSCITSSYLLPGMDFSFLSKPNITFDDGVTRKFRKLSEIYTPGFTTRNAQACQDGTNLVITALSAPDNVDQRASIRDTWAKMINEISNGTAKVVFFIGQTWPEHQRRIDREMSTHGDIVQCKVMDGNRLSAVLKEYCMVDWVSQNCPADTVTHAMKVDDDIYVIAKNLIDYVKEAIISAPPEPGAIYGMKSPGICGGWDSSDKWHTINSSSPPDTYPYRTPAYIGGSYLYARDVADRLVEAGKESFFWDMPGDQFITGVLAEQARNVSRNHEIRLQYQFGDTALDALPTQLFKVFFNQAIVIQHNFYRVPRRRHLTPEMIYEIHRIFHGTDGENTDRFQMY